MPPSTKVARISRAVHSFNLARATSQRGSWPRGSNWLIRRAASAFTRSTASRKARRSRPSRLSRDPDFVAKVEDVVGLYLDPPDKALVFRFHQRIPERG